jgi:L-alanine-DL-glutamate epimerase-like enolase superfamily enzyme
MIDLMRVGGIENFRRIATVADAFERPVTSHFIPEVSAHLIAALANGMIVEDMPRSAPLFLGDTEIDDGKIVLSSAAGIGRQLDADYIAAHRLF